MRAESIEAVLAYRFRCSAVQTQLKLCSSCMQCQTAAKMARKSWEMPNKKSRMRPKGLENNFPNAGVGNSCVFIVVYAERYRPFSCGCTAE